MKILTEIAFEKKIIESKVRDKQDEIIRHLIKVLLYPGSQDFVHWKLELKNWLETIASYKSKHNNGYLKSSDYFNLLYDEPIGDIETLKQICGYIMEDYGIRIIDYKELNKNLKEIVEFCSVKISMGVFSWKKVEDFYF